MEKIFDFQSELLGIKDLTPMAKEFRFKVPEDFRFNAGQIVTSVMNIDGKQIRRCYSIASTPSKKDFVDLCIKKIENGLATTKFFSMKKGDILRIIGPSGFFTIKDEQKDMIFISAGAGIAAYKSMIDYLFEKKTKSKLILIAGFRFEEDVLYEKHWRDLEQKNNFKFCPIISRPKDLNYKGEAGHVQDFVLKHIPQGFKGDFFICGMKDMVETTKELLISKGFKEENIIIERHS